MIRKIPVEIPAFNSHAIYPVALSQSLMKLSHEIQGTKLQWL